MVLSLYKLAINPSYPKLTVELIHMDNLQIDKDKDGFVSLDEFMTASKTDEFEKDDGWKSVEEEHPYTDDELAEFERQLQEEEKLKMAQQQAEENVKNVATKIAEVGLILNSFRLDKKHSVMHCNVLVGGAVASWLVRSSPERAVWVQALARDTVLCSWARLSQCLSPARSINGCRQIVGET